VLFKCDECGSEFNKKRGLSKHKKEHQKKRARTGHSLTTIREEDAQPVVHEEDMNDHSSSGHHSASVNKTHLKLNELINKDVENEKDEDDELFDDLLEEE
jgi:uncharacterized C2H2 Zn-finger protein